MAQWPKNPAIGEFFVHIGPESSTSVTTFSNINISIRLTTAHARVRECKMRSLPLSHADFESLFLAEIKSCMAKVRLLNGENWAQSENSESTICANCSNAALEYDYLCENCRSSLYLKEDGDSTGPKS